MSQWRPCSIQMPRVAQVADLTPDVFVRTTNPDELFAPVDDFFRCHLA